MLSKVSSLVLLLTVLFIGTATAAPVSSTYFDYSIQTQNPDAFALVRETADATLVDLGNRLGAHEEVTARPKIQVTLTSNREAFREAQSSMSAVDHWAAGTAYPAQGKIFLSIDPHDFFSKEDIAVHEIAHIAVYRAAGKRRLPRWFEEGLAIFLAGEELVTRMETATAAMVFKDLPTLATYEKRFPKASGEARLAYSVGSLFIAYLGAEHDFEANMPILFDSLRRGKPFHVAFERAMGRSLRDLESEWRAHLEGSTVWIATLSDGEIIWGLSSLLFVLVSVLAYRRKEAAIAAMPLDMTEAEDEHWPPTGMRLP